MQLKMTLSNAPSSTTPIAIQSLFLYPFYKSFRLKNGPKLATFGNLTLKYDLFYLEDDLRCVKNDTSEIVVLTTHYIDPKMVSLALLEVI